MTVRSHALEDVVDKIFEKLRIVSNYSKDMELVEANSTL
jgi:hypothetical protein